MRILVLSRHPQLYSTRRLREAAQQSGHDVDVVDYLRCHMTIASRKPLVHYRGESLLGVDAVVPRIGASHTFYGAAVVRQFEMMGVRPANESQAIVRSRDKLRTAQILSREGIGIPVTGFAHNTKDVKGLIRSVGGAPLIVKLVEGTQGIGVVLAPTQKAAESVIEAFRGLKANILVQEFVPEAESRDLRYFVIGNRVVAAMQRTGSPGEFRSNLHRGGEATAHTPRADEVETAIKAAATLGLNVAGVDLLRSKRGPLVLEVNSSPGLQGIEKATGIDVAGKVVEFMERDLKAQNIRGTGKG